MQCFIVALFVLALIATGYSAINNYTICNQCWSLNSEYCCNGKLKTCEGSSCMSCSEYGYIDGRTYPTFWKGCGNPLLCNKRFSVTTNSGLNATVDCQCGIGDYGTQYHYFQYPIASDALSGYKCPSCFTKDTDEGCEAEDDVMCIEGESECVDYRGTVILADGDILTFSLKGCIVTGGCDIGFAAFPGIKEVGCHKQFECSPATLT